MIPPSSRFGPGNIKLWVLDCEDFFKNTPLFGRIDVQFCGVLFQRRLHLVVAAYLNEYRNRTDRARDFFLVVFGDKILTKPP